MNIKLKLLKENIKNILTEEASQQKPVDLVEEMVKINEKMIKEIKKILDVDELNDSLKFGLYTSSDSNIAMVCFYLSIYKYERFSSYNNKKWVFFDGSTNVKSEVFKLISSYLESFEPTNDISKNEEIRLNSYQLTDTITNSIHTLFPWGAIYFGDVKKNSNKNNNCLNALTIIETYITKQGWGPLLYDVAIEISSKVASGLTPDRSTVSIFAYNVWNNYFKNRPDVSKIQLDIDKEQYYLKYFNVEKPLKQLTPNDEKDDCGMESALTHIEKEDSNFKFDPSVREKWIQSPLSKVYFKNNFKIIPLLYLHEMLYRKGY
jgi:hypothetical protein